MSEYKCKMATIDEMHIKWDYEISHAGEDRENWILWKQDSLKNAAQGKTIPYYGILDEKIISEATAMLDSSIVQNGDRLVDGKTAYLSAFRTIEEYQGKGYFSKLFRFMLEDLRSRGYEKVTLGVEPGEKENKQIYEHYGFCEYIKTGVEIYPDGTQIDVEYYGRSI